MTEAVTRSLCWPADGDPDAVLSSLAPDLLKPGFVVVRFPTTSTGPALPWSRLEPWTRSRAVTVADISGEVTVPAAEIALSADLVYLRESAVLRLPEAHEPPTAGLTWAFARAGRRALFQGLLDGGAINPDEARSLGLAQAVLADEADLPLPDAPSLPALLAARDLMRSHDQRARPALELATFRFLFASGHPEEGASAFLERRQPDFDTTG